MGLVMFASPIVITCVKTPKPKYYSRKKDTKELDNFFCHIKHYFDVINLLNEKEKNKSSHDVSL